MSFTILGSTINGIDFMSTNAQVMNTNNSTGSFYSIKDLFVTSEPNGYGIYEDKNSSSFATGEPIILYIEPVGFEYRNLTDESGNLLHYIDSAAGFLTSSNGTILGSQEDVPIENIVSHNQNKEVFTPFTVSQSVTFPVGDYVIIYEITDKNS